jgi:hypothetical protein
MTLVLIFFVWKAISIMWCALVWGLVLVLSGVLYLEVRYDSYEVRCKFELWRDWRSNEARDIFLKMIWSERSEVNQTGTEKSSQNRFYICAPYDEQPAGNWRCNLHIDLGLAGIYFPAELTYWHWDWNTCHRMVRNLGHYPTCQSLLAIYADVVLRGF